MGLCVNVNRSKKLLHNITIYYKLNRRWQKNTHVYDIWTQTQFAQNFCADKSLISSLAQAINLHKKKIIIFALELPKQSN